VANCPGKNAIAVAELAFGLMLALDRFIPENVNDLRDGKWNKKGFGKGRGLFGMTLGVIGMGSIGQEVAVRARAFGMPVVTYSVNLSDSEALELGVTKVSDLKELASRSDIVSLHTSLNASTKGLITAEFFDAMKPGAFFINTSRAEVVDQAALLAACESGKIRAGLDVFEGEPSTAEGAYSGAMCDARGVYCTHHIGASTEQAQEAVAAEVVRIVDVFGRSGEVLNRVN
jgi:D-3-phosphoglycerate dehydrogenase